MFKQAIIRLGGYLKGCNLILLFNQTVHTWFGIITSIFFETKNTFKTKNVPMTTYLLNY